MMISIIVPVYNAEHYLTRCIDSILSQDYGSFELILADDGSTDASAGICDRYQSQDNRVRCIHKSNGGVSSARNQGLMYVEGEYVMFVDSDDALAPGSLSSFASLIDKYAPDFILGSYNVYTDGVLDKVYATGKPSERVYHDIGSFLEDMAGDEGELFRSPWAKIFRHAVICENGLRFDENLSYAEDKLFVYGFLACASSASVIEEPVYDYYRHSGTLSWGRTDVRRASALLDMLPHYHDVLEVLMEKYPDSEAIRRICHNDMFCSDMMRVFRVFMKYKTELLSHETVNSMYSMMDLDRKIVISERRVPGQMIVSFFYLLNLRYISVCFYRAVSTVISIFRS